LPQTENKPKESQPLTPSPAFFPQFFFLALFSFLKMRRKKRKIPFKTQPNKQKKLKWSHKVVLWNHL
jgi:hypothetical protein